MRDCTPVALTMPETTSVTTSPTARDGISHSASAAVNVVPAAGVTAVTVTPDGAVKRVSAAVARLGPALRILTVYNTASPTAALGALALTRTWRSALGCVVNATPAALLLLSGSGWSAEVRVATLVTRPGAPARASNRASPLRHWRWCRRSTGRSRHRSCPATASLPATPVPMGAHPGRRRWSRWRGRDSPPRCGSSGPVRESASCHRRSW